MPRFFVTSSQIENGTVTILGDDARHISRALRMATGEEITVCDMARQEYVCELVSFLPDRVLARILSQAPSQTEPPVFITLFQALPKGDKMDSVIQKAVECGVSRIVPFESERCVVRAKPEGEAHKTERRNRIAQEAAKQCGRGILPEVSATVSFEEMLHQASECERVLFCYEGEGTLPIGRLLCAFDNPPVGQLAVVIGSEGGFSVSEAERAAECGFSMTGLGPRILRTETASGFALACICNAFELR